MADEIYDGAIGIDLGVFMKIAISTCTLTVQGTTYSCVANYEGSGVEISKCPKLHLKKHCSWRS